VALASSFEPNGKGPYLAFVRDFLIEQSAQGLMRHKYNNKAFHAQGLLQESVCFFEIMVINCDFGGYLAHQTTVLPNKRRA
jgi:hypothetical protein